MTFIRLSRTCVLETSCRSLTTQLNADVRHGKETLAWELMVPSWHGSSIAEARATCAAGRKASPSGSVLRKKSTALTSEAHLLMLASILVVEAGVKGISAGQ